MSNVVVALENKAELVIMQGDLSRLSPEERLSYVKNVCASLGLNPLTRPFDYHTFQNKMVLYARKDCAEQLRKIHGVSITNMQVDLIDGLYVVRVTAKDKDGKEDMATGAVTIEGLKGEAKANAMLKAETKAKRRVTLSICGLGILDESELESVGVASPPGQPPAGLGAGKDEWASKVDSLVERFRKIGVSELMICHRYGIESAVGLNEEQFEELKTIGPLVSSDRTKKNEFFPPGGTP